MFAIHPHDALGVVRQYARRLREETAAPRVRRAAAADCPLAALFRRLRTFLGRPASGRGTALSHRPA